jgi:hypothetical protein
MGTLALAGLAPGVGAADASAAKTATEFDRAGRPGTGVVRITKTATGWKKGQETWTFEGKTETIAPSR